MKLINLVAVFVFCSSIVSAETTFELIKQRAESGDVTAQNLLGLMSWYGYLLPRDMSVSDQWYQRAADQGDQFAQERVAMSKRRTNAGTSTSTSIRPSEIDLFRMPASELEKKISQASSAKFAGDVTFDELFLDRNKYIGKTVELRFTAISAIGGATTGNPHIYVRKPRTGDEAGGGSDRLFLCGREAMEWKLEVEKKSFDTASTVYALVEKDGLIALGTRKRKVDDGYKYSW